MYHVHVEGWRFKCPHVHCALFCLSENIFLGENSIASDLFLHSTSTVHSHTVCPCVEWGVIYTMSTTGALSDLVLFDTMTTTVSIILFAKSVSLKFASGRGGRTEKIPVGACFNHFMHLSAIYNFIILICDHCTMKFSTRMV